MLGHIIATLVYWEELAVRTLHGRKNNFEIKILMCISQVENRLPDIHSQIKMLWRETRIGNCKWFSLLTKSLIQELWFKINHIWLQGSSMSPFQIANRICIVSLGTHYSSKENCQITNQMSNQISRNTYLTPINFCCPRFRTTEN